MTFVRLIVFARRHSFQNLLDILIRWVIALEKKIVVDTIYALPFDKANHFSQKSPLQTLACNCIRPIADWHTVNKQP